MYKYTSQIGLFDSNKQQLSGLSLRVFFSPSLWWRWKHHVNPQFRCLSFVWLFKAVPSFCARLDAKEVQQKFIPFVEETPLLWALVNSLRLWNCEQYYWLFVCFFSNMGDSQNLLTISPGFHFSNACLTSRPVSKHQLPLCQTLITLCLPCVIHWTCLQQARGKHSYRDVGQRDIHSEMSLRWKPDKELWWGLLRCVKGKSHPRSAGGLAGHLFDHKPSGKECQEELAGDVGRPIQT